jgi:hypothetical protein
MKKSRLIAAFTALSTLCMPYAAFAAWNTGYTQEAVTSHDTSLAEQNYAELYELPDETALGASEIKMLENEE